MGMFTFYEMEVGSDRWSAHFLHKEEIRTIKNDKGALQRLLSKINYLVGYDNYSIYDKLLASILKDLDPYDTLQRIQKNKRVSFGLQNPVSIDLKQELGDLKLDEIRYNLDLKKDTDNLALMQKIFKEREDYFASKFEVVKEFKLSADSLKKTRVGLAADVLKTKKTTDKERLNIKYSDKLAKQELPKQVLGFYEDVQNRFKNGVDYGELEKEKFTFKIAGLEHIYGFGGLHAAKENYVDEGHFMQIDVKSYYPTLILNNSFLAPTALDTYKTIYNTRKELQAENDTKEQAYKLITNIVYGGLKTKWSNLYNPQMSNSVVVNGQLILTHLILLLENFCELIQTNTDGIIIKYDPVMESGILKIIELFEEHYSLEFDIDYITKIAQRDVNNYVVRYKGGEIKGVGRFANYDGGDFERNSLAIIDKALVNHYMNGIKVNKTIIDEWKKGNLTLFQNIVKPGKYDGLAQEKKEPTLIKDEYDSRFDTLLDVVRVFATNDRMLGGIYKTRKRAETQYIKVPYTSENCLVWNGDLKELNKRNIDLNWYINETRGWLF